MKVTLVHNPTAGDGIASARELRSMLEESGYRVRLTSTTKAWESALKKPADLVVAAGGDGTARKVALATAGTGVPMAVLPFGTANNIGKTLRILGSARGIMDRWRSEEPRPLDLGLAKVGGERHRFVEAIGFGIIGDLIASGREAVEEEPVFVGRETDRALHLLAHVAREAPLGDWRVEIDGRDCSGRYVAVEVLNVRFGGPNVPLAPDADPGDGLLDVVLVDEEGRRRLVDYAERRLETASAEPLRLAVERARTVRVTPPPGTRIHVDDELLETADRDAEDDAADEAIAIEIMPGACRIVTGRED